MAFTAAFVRCSSGRLLGHVHGPAVVSLYRDAKSVSPKCVVGSILRKSTYAQTAKDIAIVHVDGVAKVFSAGSDVVVGIVAVSTRSVTTLVSSNLHETKGSAVGRRSVGPAVTLLHGDGGNENGRKVVGGTILVEEVEVVGARGEDVAVPELIKTLVLNHVHGNIRRGPATALDTTVHPLDGTVRSSGR